ncbi:hypothetical protein diail_3988 [Diaporthe ilicicola]|nr:hypothetical protein diail_3988 [Diaporthe ilicicola]
MTSSKRKDLLAVCIDRCEKLVRDVESFHQLKRLHHHAQLFLASLRWMSRQLHLEGLHAFGSNPAKNPGLSLLAAYLYDLRKTCGYYGINAETEWRLDDKVRGSALDDLGNPFERVAWMLHHLGSTLREVFRDKEMNSQTRAQKLCQWVESMSDHWNFFRVELGAARGLAAAASAASVLRPAALTPISADGSEGLCSAKAALKQPEVHGTHVWDKMREQLAAEGISDEAIEGVADDLIACARSLVRGERPLGPDESDLTNHTSKNSNATENGEPESFSGVSDDPFNREVVSSKITTALDRLKLKNAFELYLPEVLVVAFEQETKKDCRNYRQVLDLIHKMACRCTDPVSPVRVLARLAKEIQVHTPAHIRETMSTQGHISNDTGIVSSAEEPVTGYLFNKCLEDWEHGKHGRNKISAENFALGVSRFIGELTKFGVFNAGHVHFFIREQWGSTLKRNQFMAVCKLLKMTGPMLDSQPNSGDMEDHFKRIRSLMAKKKTSDVMKALAQELISLRSSGWKLKGSGAMDQVEEAISKRA